jgi:hypothetical protein
MDEDHGVARLERLEPFVGEWRLEVPAFPLSRELADAARTARQQRDVALAQALPWPRRVEREFGRLKHEWALLPLRIRGLERVQLHADLTILAKLSCALARARAAPLAA